MATGDVRVLDVQHSDHEPLRSAVSAGGLGYSRHYAQRIRDLGRTSKDGWIKRLFNHMFGSSSSSGNRKLVVKTEDAGTHAAAAGGNLTGRRSSDHVDHRGLSSDSSENSKTVHQASHEVMVQRQMRSNHEPAAGRAMPAQLINSPYLPPSNKVVYYRPVLTAKPGGNARDGVQAAKLRYQRMSKSSTALRSSTVSHVDAFRSSTISHVDASDDPHKSGHMVLTIRRQFRQRDTATIQMEKRAKTVADRAIMVRINVSFTTNELSS